MNPVTAGLVPSPDAWFYSSHKDYVKARAGMVSTSEILAILGGHERYVRFLMEYDPTEPESAWEFVVRGKTIKIVP